MHLQGLSDVFEAPQSLVAGKECFVGDKLLELGPHCGQPIRRRRAQAAALGALSLRVDSSRSKRTWVSSTASSGPASEASSAALKNVRRA